jgi:hypothetical protein
MKNYTLEVKAKGSLADLAKYLKEVLTELKEVKTPGCTGYSAINDTGLTIIKEAE